MSKRLRCRDRVVIIYDNSAVEPYNKEDREIIYISAEWYIVPYVKKR